MFLKVRLPLCILLLTGLLKAEITLDIDETQLDRQPGAITSYAPALRQATPAIVSVHTSKIVRIIKGTNHRQEMLRRLFGLPQTPGQQGNRRIEERKQPSGVGSGVILSEDGYIVTNAHVIEASLGRNQQSSEIFVRLDDGRELEAKLVGVDTQTDLAVLKVEADSLPTLPIANSDSVEIGDVVFAIGNPMAVGLTVTQGIISAKGRKIGIYGQGGYEHFLQTDASINPGNSGGALVDARGRLLGINSAILSRNGGGSVGIGFAIPSRMLVRVVEQLVNIGEVRRGFLGIRHRDLDQDLAEAVGLESPRGVIIEEVIQGTPAHRAGFRHGDVILTIGSESIDDANHLRVVVAQIAPGTQVKVEVLRGSGRLTLTVQLGDLSQGAPAALVEGVAARMLNTEDRNRLGLEGNVRGVLIESVHPDSPLHRYLREDMVLLEINDQQPTTVDAARSLLRRGTNKLYIYDQGRMGYIGLRFQ